MKTAVVLAGGLGTRLASVSNGTPKVLMEVNGKPFIQHVLDKLIDAGCEEVVIAASYKWEELHALLEHTYRNLVIRWSIETEPLGTGGAIKQAFEMYKLREAIVVNADTIFDIDMDHLIHFHKNHTSRVTLALRSVDDVDRYGEVTVDDYGCILTFNEKSRTGPGLINGGIYIIDGKFWQDRQLPKVFSFERDCLQQGRWTDQLYGVALDGYFIDIGIPEDLERARNEFKIS